MLFSEVTALREGCDYPGSILRMHVLKDALAKELFGSVAEDTLHGRTLVADDALGVDNGDDVQGVLDERTELALAAVYLAAEIPQAGVLHGAGEGLILPRF